MGKRNLEEEIANLGRLREAPATDRTLSAIRKGLADRANLVAAKAAQAAGDLGLKTLIPDLVASYDRQFRNAAQTDPQCWAKNALAKALTALDLDESAPFLRGYQYEQWEASCAGKTDTAVTLRSLCTLALVQCADLPRAEKLRHLVVAVTDPEEIVRIDALRAVEQMEGEEAALLLRLKARVGDKRAAVVGQALESLLRLEGSRALEFARNFLKERHLENARELPSTAEEVIEEAALALGASRLPAGVEALQEAWRAHPRTVFLQAISASRLESGFDFLVGLVRSGRQRDAADAIEVLSLHRDSQEVKAAAQSAVEERGDAGIAAKFRASFA